MLGCGDGRLIGERMMFAAWPREMSGVPPSTLRCFSTPPAPPSRTGGERFLEPTSSDKISLMEKERDLPPPGLLEGDLRVLLLLLLLPCSVSAMQENCGWR